MSSHNFLVYQNNFQKKIKDLNIKGSKYKYFFQLICNNSYICAGWADGPRARDISFSRATKERGRTMFEGLGPSAHSAHTQFYNIEAFSSQKGDKTFVFLNFPRFPPNFRKKLWRRKTIRNLLLANREKGHERSFGAAIRIELSRPNRGRFRPEKSAFV